MPKERAPASSSSDTLAAATTALLSVSASQQHERAIPLNATEEETKVQPPAPRRNATTASAPTQESDVDISAQPRPPPLTDGATNAAASAFTPVSATIPIGPSVAEAAPAATRVMQREAKTSSSDASPKTRALMQQLAAWPWYLTAQAESALEAGREEEEKKGGQLQAAMRNNEDASQTV